MKISLKVTILLISIVVTAVGLLSMISFTQGSEIIHDRVSAQLNSINVLKQNQLLEFIDEEKEDMIELSKNDYLKTMLENLHNDLHDENLHNDLRHLLLDEVEGGDFSEIFIIDKNAIVHISTNPLEEEKIKSNQNFFIYGKTDSYIQTYSYDIGSAKPFLAVSTPIFNKESQLLGILVGKINQNEISEILLERSGLGNTGETILVTSTNLLVTKSRFIDNLEFKKTIYAQAVKNCLNKESGTRNYLDYRNVPAIINYQWMESLQVCMIAKIDETEAFQPIRTLGIIIILSGIIISVLSGIFGYLYTKKLTFPIKKLVKATNEISNGNFGYKVDTHTKDELGILGDSFNLVGMELKKAQIQEKKYHNRLKSEVKKKTEELEEKMEMLEKFNKLATGREIKMIELKNKIKELEKNE